MSSFYDRLEKIRELRGVNKKDFCLDLGIASQYYIKIKKIDNPNINLLKKIKNLQPNINLEWLLLGNGGMFLDNNTTLQITDGANIHQNIKMFDVFSSDINQAYLKPKSFKQININELLISHLFDDFKTDKQFLYNHLKRLEDLPLLDKAKTNKLSIVKSKAHNKAFTLLYFDDDIDLRDFTDTPLEFKEFDKYVAFELGVGVKGSFLKPIYPHLDDNNIYMFHCFNLDQLIPIDSSFNNLHESMDREIKRVGNSLNSATNMVQKDIYSKELKAFKDKMDVIENMNINLIELANMDIEIKFSCVEIAFVEELKIITKSTNLFYSYLHNLS